MPVATEPADLESRIAAAEARPGYVRPAAYAIGLATFGGGDAASRKVLDTYYPLVNLHQHPNMVALLAEATGYAAGSATRLLDLPLIDQVLSYFPPRASETAPHPNRQVLRAVRDILAGAPAPEPAFPRRGAVVTFIGDLAAPPVDAHDVYLRLHLLSHRKVQPHGLNLEGVFGLLNNVVWTNLGPFDPDDFEQQRLRLRARGQEVRVRAIDKFPPMADYVVPGGVRVADADRVRLGAYLGPGTTVMHEGFVNFNAGTLGASMVEGRISAGVVVGNGSDVGGGASIMGTLSGGGKQVIRVGESCLIGANAGIGISLGDNCTVEAGLYVTAGSRVRLPDGRVVKAVELSGQPDLLYRRNSQTGAIEVLGKKNQVLLNAALHANQ